MKQLLLLLLLPCLLHAQIQEGYYAEYLRDSNGMPAKHVSVMNRRTQKTVYTDDKGFFQIQAKAGDIVRVYFPNAIKDISIENGMLQAEPPKRYLPVPITSEPLISEDYNNLIKAGQPKPKQDLLDSIINGQAQKLQAKQGYYGYRVQRVKEVNGKLKLVPAYTKRLSIGGSFISSIEVKTVNQLPALQSTYAQGSSKSGTITYQGPETNETFSYGPNLQLLEFDGIAYPYDANGKLVLIGTGNGKLPNVYNNNIFRTGSVFVQSLSLLARLSLSSKSIWNFSLNMGKKKENSFIQHNINTNQNLAASVSTNLSWLNMSASYSQFVDRFSNSNRNGFLNRAYQQASIAPASFDNGQGSMIGTKQRSYSNLADNPYFLLMDNGNSYHQSQKLAGLAFEKKRGNFNFRLDQSVEQVLQQSNEAYKTGTVYFSNGFSTERIKSDKNYFLKGNAAFHFSGYYFRAKAYLTYVFNNAITNIDYSEGSNFHYQRTSHDVSLAYQASYNRNSLDIGGAIDNKFYFSNTSKSSALLIPSINAYIRVNEIFDVSGLYGKFYTAINTTKFEPVISNSLAYANLLQHTAEQSMQYFPLMEANGYDNLEPIHQNEYKLGMELNYKYNLIFTAELFIKKIRNDVFPIYSNGMLQLQNIASHRTNGVEIQLVYSGKNARTFSHSHGISFFAYQNEVTHVEDGFNNTPIAGFSNVNKAIIEGQPLGVIVGNSFQRNGDNKVLIGTDGFPLVNNNLTVLGNPIPDFVIKLNNGLTYKRLALNLDWEWSKGGDRWNGTQAVLDYYGRSQTSADSRNITNYVFDGVLQNGQHNNVPVNFYDANLPVTQNRWTRYGLTGVAEEYIQKTDCIRLRTAAISYNWRLKKYLQNIKLAAFVNNIMLWTAYKGADPNQLLFDQSNTSGLDYFNLPSTKSMGINLTIQF